MKEAPPFLKPFLNATLNVLNTMAATDATAGTPCAECNCAPFGTVTGVIGMAGNVMTGNLVISFDENCILAIVNRMLMEEFTTINQDVIDAVGEITNMICGGAKKELAEQGLTFDMATPMVFKGKNLGLQSTTRSHYVMVPFQTGEGRFMLETDLEAKP